jgi:hypothetical protein
VAEVVLRHCDTGLAPPRSRLPELRQRRFGLTLQQRSNPKAERGDAVLGTDLERPRGGSASFVVPTGRVELDAAPEPRVGRQGVELGGLLVDPQRLLQSPEAGEKACVTRVGPVGARIEFERA